jgi:SAM-dependent methyltransferase
VAQDHNVADRMRADWNRRAEEDAHYYVAFGRHGQGEEEFESTAYEVVYGLEYELRRRPRNENPRARRALEIGCGPGRLMKPMSRHFGEIHGVDVSDAMITLARERLQGIPHAHAHVSTAGADLRQFADESFDFVYSYAVFQHIPSRDVVLSYLHEARRVLKTGGQLWFQVNGLPDHDAPPADTWSGVRFQPDEIVAFANANDFQMYALEGVGTQYMWTSLRKRPQGWFQELPVTPPATTASIRRISNPHGTEPGVPCGGRFSVASLWVAGLHPECGLNHLRCRIGGTEGLPNYIAPMLPVGEQQVNVVLPEGLPTGLIPVELEWLGRRIGDPAILRVVPPSPQVPRLRSVSDANDLLLGPRIVSGDVKLVLEEVNRVEDVQAWIDGEPVAPYLVHWSDRRTPRLELVYRVEGPAGTRRLQVQARKQRFPVVLLEVPAILEKET